LGDLAFFIGFERHVDELGAQRLDLFARGGPHVRGFDHRTQPLGRGDGLQAGHPGSQHDGARGFQGAGGGHHHGNQAAVIVRGEQHGLVAGQVGLGRQHVQALRAGDAGRGFQRESDESYRGHLFQAFGVEGIKHADDDSARFHLGQFSGSGRANLQDEFRAQRILGGTERSARGLIGVIQKAGGGAGPTLHDNGVFAAYVLLDGLRCCCDTGFPVSGLFWYPDVHRRLS